MDPWVTCHGMKANPTGYLWSKYECFLVSGSQDIAGAQFEGDLGEVLALGAEISPCIGLREKWESP